MMIAIFVNLILPVVSDMVKDGVEDLIN